MDVYHYGGNNPVKLVDPDGNWTLPILIYVAYKRNAPDQDKLKDLQEDPDTVRLPIYTEGRAFEQEGLHHLWVTDGKDAAGRHGKSGRDLTGTDGGPKDLKSALEDKNAHNKVGEVLLPAGTDTDAFMDKVKENAIDGVYLPFFNDCHNTIKDTAREFGGEVDYNENYKGRVGK